VALIRWSREGDIFSEMSRLQRDMSRLFGEFSTRTDKGYKASVYPPLNIYNDSESLIVLAEVPGIDPKTLDLHVTDDTLTLSGERTLPELPEGASYHRRERDFGQFRRTLTLPEKVDSKRVVASCKDGILEVRLPRAEEAKARRISVKAS